jgi:aminoglycoside phosphotransferase family enzyme
MKPNAPRTPVEHCALAAKTAWLADPRHYPHRPRVVACIETHFAWIFLAGERVYKLKKPLHRASMDYRTVALRERACRAELELNRRLAPQVYRRVVPLGRTRAGELTLRAGAFEVVDWLVQMRRLGAARMLDQAIRARSVQVRDLKRIAIRLAAFFRTAQPLPMSERGYFAHLCRQVRASGCELGAADLALASARVQTVVARQLAWLERRSHLLRGRGRLLRDGHGDLGPEHVFLGTASHAACVIDCLEFDPRLRRLDPAEEIAFLALECRRLGAARLAAALLEHCILAMDDTVAPAVMAFYMSRRAVVRALIAAWHLRDPAFATRVRLWRARAHSYLDDALREIRRAEWLAARAAVAEHPRAAGQSDQRSSSGATGSPLSIRRTV